MSRSTCSYDGGCDRAAHKDGLCEKHWQQMHAPLCKHPDGCKSKARTQGWCRVHWKRVKASPTGDPGPIGRKDARKTCKHRDGCPRMASTKGWCATHWRRIQNSPTGDPGPVESLYAPKRCKHPDGCDRQAYKNGWCSMHNQRVEKSPTGDPGPVESRQGHWRDENGIWKTEKDVCAYEPCGEEARFAAGVYCNKHEQRWRLNGDPGIVTGGHLEDCDCVRCVDKPNGTKWCCYGEHFAALTEFHSKGGGKKSPSCRSCGRYANYERKYGKSRSDIQSILDDQHWTCPIGKENLVTVGWVIDHDHRALCGCGPNGGCITCMRAILCDNCNKTIGRFGDDPVVIRRMIGKTKHSEEFMTACAQYLDLWHGEMVRRGSKTHDFVGPAMEFFGELLTEVLGQPKLA